MKQALTAFSNTDDTDAPYANMLELSKPKYAITPYSTTIYTVVVKNSARTARKLNEVTKRYPTDTKFKNSDEPLFFFPVEQLPIIKKLLRIKN